jgi:TonB family protein
MGGKIMRRLRLAAFSRTCLLVTALVLSGKAEALPVDQSPGIRLVFFNGYLPGSPVPGPSPLPSALAPPPEADSSWASDLEMLGGQVIQSLGLQSAIILSIRSVVPQPGATERIRSRGVPYVVEVRSDGEGRFGVRCFRGHVASESADFIPLSLEPGGTAVLAAEPSGPLRWGFALTLLAPGSRIDEIHTVGGGVSPPRLIEKIEPHYPQSARKQKKSGVVVLQSIVDENGRVGSVWVGWSDDPALAAAAFEAVHQWRYEPALKDGKPVRVLLTVTVTFSLH